ncbi:hypothetical protein ACHWQZ_G002437 [Mnemiopsis leidyi]
MSPSKREVRVEVSPPVFRHQYEISVGDITYFLTPNEDHGVPQIVPAKRKGQAGPDLSDSSDMPDPPDSSYLCDLSDPPDLSDQPIQRRGSFLPDRPDNLNVETGHTKSQLEIHEDNPCEIKQAAEEKLDKHKEQVLPEVRYYVRSKKLDVLGQGLIKHVKVAKQDADVTQRTEIAPCSSTSATEEDQFTREPSKSRRQSVENISQDNTSPLSIIKVENGVAGSTSKTDVEIAMVVKLLNGRPAPLTDEMDIKWWCERRDSFAKQLLALKVSFVSSQNSLSERVPVSCEELSYQFTSWIVIEEVKEEERVVKLGRKPIYLMPIAHHWAIQVGDLWYEIGRKNKVTRINAVEVSPGYAAKSGAGRFGGEVVGTTTKSNGMINNWVGIWLALNPHYHLLRGNCQKFSYELMIWLTDHNYLCNHRVDAGNICTLRDNYSQSSKVIAASKQGNSILHFNSGENNITTRGPFNIRNRGANLTFQAVAGPGLGLFIDASSSNASRSAGNLVGVHYGLSIDTGIGARNGNLEAHLAGFGGKIGADGIELNTPVGGINACCLM